MPSKYCEICGRYTTSSLEPLFCAWGCGRFPKNTGYEVQKISPASSADALLESLKNQQKKKAEESKQMNLFSKQFPK